MICKWKLVEMSGSESNNRSKVISVAMGEGM